MTYCPSCGWYVESDEASLDDWRCRYCRDRDVPVPPVVPQQQDGDKPAPAVAVELPARRTRATSPAYKHVCCAGIKHVREDQA